MTIDEIQNMFQNFSDGVRVVLLIHRSKEGGFNNTHKRHLKKVITRNSEEFWKTVKEFKELKDNDTRTLRIYANFNSRDINKAIRLFKQRQLDRDYENEEHRNDFYFNVKNQFISCLMDKSCAKEKNFLFDLDGCDDRSLQRIYKLIEKQTEILLFYNTKNGYHIITRPFNYNNLDSQIVEFLHKDSLMLLDF